MTISTISKRSTRIKWTREDYKNVLRAFYIAKSRPNSNNTEQTFVEWRTIVGPHVCEDLNPNTLGNETDVTDLFPEQYNHENKHARKDILN